MSKENQSPNTYTKTVYEDEISLVDIVRVLLRRKKLIFGITTIAVCIGLLYAFTQKRVYQVETVLLPPSFEYVQPLNVLSRASSTGSVSSDNVFKSFTDTVKSRKLRQAFFNKFKILEILSDKSNQVLTEREINIIFERFSKLIKFTGSNTIILEGTNKKLLGKWLDDFVAMANQETINQLVRNLQSEIDSKIKILKIEIVSKRSSYKKRNEDELGRLQESLQIAKELGIRDHLFVPKIEVGSNHAVLAELNSISRGLSNEDNLSAYMKGTRVLQAEINALKKRKLGDIHITGLRDIQEELTRIESIKIERDKLQTVIVDKKASVSIETIGPKRKKIVILSIILGGILAVFAVFFIEFINNFKNQLDS